MINLNTIEIKFIPPTTFRGAKIKLTSPRFESSVTISYEYSNTSWSSTYELAQEWLESKGFVCEYMSEGRSCYYIHSSTFISSKDIKTV